MAKWTNFGLFFPHFLFFVTLVLLSIPSVSQSEQTGVSSGTLYGPEDKVILLNATNLKSHIYKSSRAWVVEFFSSWCGHCIQFAPLWKQFAQDLAGWQNVVAIAGIDCADESNIPTCREFEIMGYPSLLLYGPNAQGKLKDKEGKLIHNRGEFFKRSETMWKMKRGLMDALVPMFPEILTPPNVTITSDENQFWQDSHLGSASQPSFVLLMYESNSSYVGKEVALQLSQYPDIRVYRFLKKNPMYKRLGLQGWPAAGYVKRGGTSGTILLGKNQDLVDLLNKAVIGLAEFSAFGNKAEESSSSTSADKISRPPKIIDNVNNVIDRADTEKHKVARDVVSMEDLIHAVRNSLRNEIGLAQHISGSRLEALKNYIHILNQLFPADRRELKIFFMKLETWLWPQSDIPSTAYLDTLSELEIELNPWDINIKNNNWVDCKGSMPGRRGYTCGLWRLFHSLTIIAFDKNDNSKVLEAIHGYVKEFFGCRECADHFTAMVSEDNALSIVAAEGQALWLWRAHNKVNLRLKGSASEDPMYPKQIYPYKRQCPKCYIGPTHLDENKVLEYLLRIYTRPERSYLEIENPQALPIEVRNMGNDSENQPNPNSAGFFSVTDIGLFMIVYFSVACLLILGYVHFKMVAKRRIDPSMLCRRLCSPRSMV